MADERIHEILQAISDGQAATIALTDSAGSRQLCDCRYKSGDAPSFSLFFPPGALPEQLDFSKSCPVTSHDGDHNLLSFLADIIDRTDSRTLEMVARKSVRPEDLRDYFRVSLQTDIVVRYTPLGSEDGAETAQLEGETVDISQSGVLAILADECKTRHEVQLQLLLPNPPNLVTCFATLVRVKKLRKGRFLTAFHFTEIRSKDRDIIAKNCFAEQRRQLREHVQTP